MTDKNWKHPHSLAAYPEEIRDRARAAYVKWSFMDNPHWDCHPLAAKIKDGFHDDVPAMRVFAHTINEREKSVAGVMCKGCGSNWDDARLAAEKAKRPELLSCCPERRMRRVAWVAE